MLKFNNRFVGGSALLLKLIYGMLVNEQCCDLYGLQTQLHVVQLKLISSSYTNHKCGFNRYCVAMVPLKISL